MYSGASLRMADALEKERQIAVLVAEQRTAAQKLQTLQSQLDAALVEKQALQTKDAQTSRKLVRPRVITPRVAIRPTNDGLHLCIEYVYT
jgi:hypothetical protein